MIGRAVLKSRERRAPLAIVLAGVAATVIGSTAPAAALEVLDDVVTTTTSILTDVADAVVDATGESTTTTTSTSTSTTSTTSTSSTSTSSTSTPTSTTSTTAAPVAVTTTTAPAAVTSAAPATADPAVSPVEQEPLPLPLLESMPHELPAALATPAGPRSTLEVLALLRPRGATPQLVARILSPFPVAGAAHYSNDWGAPRHGPPAHSHAGTDIFAERGTPVIASGEGVVSRMTTTGRLGGTSLRLTTASGTYFYYAHLDRFVDGLADGDRVRTGDVIGFVGQTGNVAGTPPHLHYEVHPRGGAAVPPVPYLDRWLQEAVATARTIVFSPAVESVLSVQPNQPLSIAAPVRSKARAPEQLSLRRIDGQPASTAVDPVPLLAFAVPVAGVSWLAHRSNKRARRRLKGAQK